MDLLINYRLSGVEEAHKKNEKLSQKGVKAYFMLDESGLLSIEKIEAHFEKSPEQAEEDEQSTFQSMYNSFFFGTRLQKSIESNKYFCFKHETGSLFVFFLGYIKEKLKIFLL